MRRAAVWSALIVLALGAIFVVRPFVAEQRDQPAEVPSPASLSNTDTVPLVEGAPACFRHAVAEHHSEFVRFKVASPDGPAPPIDVKITGPGYQYTASIPAGQPDGAVVQAPMPAPPGDVPVRVCFSSRGGPAIGLFASSDRTRSRSIAYIDGKSTDKSIWFTFAEPAPRAILERLPDTVRRMTVFRPSWVGRVLLWAIAVLFIVGVPAGVVWAYARGLRDDEREIPREIDVNERRSWWRRVVG
jgi:hypothetical protein